MTRRALFRESTTGALDDGAGGTVHGVPDPSGEPDGKVLETSSGALVYATPASGDVAGDTHAATSKTTPVDNDEIPLADSAASYALKKLLWSNVKATLKTYFDTLYPSGSGTSTGTNTGDQTSVSGNAGTATKLATARNIDGQSFDGSANITVIAPGTHAATSKTTPVDADELPLVDSAASNVLKKVTWANLKATLKTYFDTIYAPIGGGGGGFTVVDYAQFTANVNVSVTTEGTAVSIVAGAGFTADGTSHYMVEFFSPGSRPDTTAAARTLNFVLLEGSTVISGFYGQIRNPAAAGFNVPVLLRRRLTPASGTRTYSVAAFVSAGTGVVAAGADGSGNFPPGYIMVTKLA